MSRQETKLTNARSLCRALRKAAASGTPPLQCCLRLGFDVSGLSTINDLVFGTYLNWLDFLATLEDRETRCCEAAENDGWVCHKLKSMCSP